MSRASRIVWLIVVVLTGFVLGNGSAQDVASSTQVPTLTGLSVADAKAAAMKAGLEAKFELGESPQSPDQALMTYAQSPAAGTDAARGEVVTLTIYAKAASSAQSAEGTIGLQTVGRQPNGQVAVPSRISQSSPEVPASVTVVSGVPADHLISESGSLLANDLSHGEGWSLMTVRRTWLGRDTVNTHFGVGWSDPNLVRLTLLSADRLLIWRGGTGWRTAQRDGDQFATGDGDTIRTTPAGWQMRFVSGEEWRFNPNGTLATIQSALGSVRKFAYEGDRLTVIEDGPDNRLHYHYDAQHNRVSHVDGPEGLSLQYVYDAQGRLSRVTTARAIAIDYRYNGNGQLVVARDQFGTQFLRAPSVDDSAKPSATPPAVAPPANVNGDTSQPGATENRSTAQAPGLKAPATPPPPSLLLLSRPRFKFDQRGLVTEQEDDGRTTHYSHDEAGRVSSAAGPQGRISFTYDSFGRTTGVTLPDSRTSSTQYNSLGLPVLIVLPDGTRQTLTYNRQGMLTRAEDSSGDWEETEYDPHGRVRVVRSAPALEVRYVYDDRDRVARLEYSTGKSVVYLYDKSGNELSETWSTGEQNSWVYDEAGQVVGSTDAAGLKTTHVYDEAGHLMETRDAVHGKTVFQHAATGLQYSMEREDLGTTSIETTPWGLPLITRGPGNRVTTVQYNERFKPLVVSTASQLAWRYEYDLADRMTGILAPGGQRTILSHDIGGRVAAVTRCGVAWRQYRYDAFGRLERETSSAGVVETCKYDAAGRIVEVRRPEGVIRLTRDPAGTKTSVQGPGYEVEESVHPDGSLARRVYRPAELDLKLPQDKAGRPAGVELNGVKVGYAYGARGSLERIELPGGNDIAVVTDAAQRPTRLSFGPALNIDVTYDRADRIVNIVASGLAMEPVFSERSAYDEAGNLSRLESGESPPRVMEYDADDRLRKVTREPPGPGEQSFDYDVGGNLWATGAEGTRSAWELDEGGRPTAREALQYTWSASGNLTKTEGHGSRIENSFDAADRLVRRRVGPLEWSYGYLPEGDRLWQQSGTGKTWYAYLPTGLVGIKDEAGVTWLLVTLPDTDWPLALCGSNGETYFAVADRLGSLRRLVDPQGKLVASADYGPFGNREAGSGQRKLSLYAGMVRDDSGLYYARQRYYDPHLARFISIDPLLGSHDLPASHDAYAYAANNPYRFRDPSGASLSEAQQLRLANQLVARNLAIAERVNAFRARQALLGSATKVHSGLGRLAGAGASVAKEETLELIAKRLAHAERTLQNPASSAAAKEYANTTLKKLTEQVEGLGRQMKSQNVAGQADIAEQIARRKSAGMTGKVATKAAGGTTQKVAAIAATDATEKAAEGAAKRGLSAAGEELAEGGIRRWGGRALRGVVKVAVPISVALDLWGSYEAIQGGKAMNGALAQAESADRKAQAAQKALEEMLGRLAADPTKQGRIIPRDADGKPLGIEELIGIMHDNIAKNRKPLTGILTEGGTTVPPAAQQGLEAAMAKAVGILNQARVLQLAMDKARAEIARQEALAKKNLDQALRVAVLKGPLYKRLFRLSDIANDVKTQTGVVNARADAAPQAYAALQSAAVEANSNAGIICSHVSQTATAAQARQWQHEAAKQIAEVATALQNAQSDVQALDGSANVLRASMNPLESLKSAKEELEGTDFTLPDGASTVASCLAAAQQAEDAAEKQRVMLRQWADELRQVKPRVEAVLAPYKWDFNAFMLLDSIELSDADMPDVPATSSFSLMLASASLVIDPFLKMAESHETELVKIDIARLLEQAQEALDRIQSAKAGSPAIDLTAAHRALEESKKCAAAIKIPTDVASQGDPSNPLGDDPQTLTTPPVKGTPDDADQKVRVRSVLLRTAAEGKAVLAGDGLRVAFVAAQTRTPSTSEEFRIQRQDPAGGEEVEKGALVTLTVYGKFGADVPQTPEVAGKIRVRSVLTLSPAEARGILTGDGLKVKFVASKTHPLEQGQEKEIVIQRQDPPGGTDVDPGSTAVVTLTIGGKKEVTEPSEPTAPTSDPGAGGQKTYNFVMVKWSSEKEQGNKTDAANFRMSWETMGEFGGRALMQVPAQMQAVMKQEFGLGPDVPFPGTYRQTDGKYELDLKVLQTALDKKLREEAAKPKEPGGGGFLGGIVDIEFSNPKLSAQLKSEDANLRLWFQLSLNIDGKPAKLEAEYLGTPQ